MFLYKKKDILILHFVLFFLLASLGGCGLIYDAGVGIASINLPEWPRGKLYDPDFYRTATPEDVRELVGNRSLAGESTTYTKKRFARNRDMLGINDLFSPIIPNSYVGKREEFVRPVDVARKYSPSQEVVTIIERASGIPPEESLAYRLLASEYSAAAGLLEEYKDAPFSCAVSAILAGRLQTAELKIYLDQHPQANLDCMPEGIYNGSGNSLYFNTPLVAAMNAKSIVALRLLRERGATLDSWRLRDVNTLFPRGAIADELLKAGGRIPQDTCDRVAQNFSYNDEDRYDFFMQRLFDQCAFSPDAEKSMIRKAVIWNRPDLVQKLLARGARFNAKETYYINSRAKGDRTELKRILADHGAVLEDD